MRHTPQMAGVHILARLKNYLPSKKILLTVAATIILLIMPPTRGLILWILCILFMWDPWKPDNKIHASPDKIHVAVPYPQHRKDLTNKVKTSQHFSLLKKDDLAIVFNEDENGLAIDQFYLAGVFPPDCRIEWTMDYNYHEDAGWDYHRELLYILAHKKLKEAPHKLGTLPLNPASISDSAHQELLVRSPNRKNTGNEVSPVYVRLKGNERPSTKDKGLRQLTITDIKATGPRNDKVVCAHWIAIINDGMSPASFWVPKADSVHWSHVYLVPVREKNRMAQIGDQYLPLEGIRVPPEEDAALWSFETWPVNRKLVQSIVEVDELGLLTSQLGAGGLFYRIGSENEKHVLNHPVTFSMEREGRRIEGEKIEIGINLLRQTQKGHTVVVGIAGYVK